MRKLWGLIIQCMRKLWGLQSREISAFANYASDWVLKYTQIIMNWASIFEILISIIVMHMLIKDNFGTICTF